MHMQMNTTDKSRATRRLLEESEQRYRSLFEFNPDGVFLLSREARFTSLNPAAELISGYSLDELVSINPNRLIVAEHLERTLANFQGALAGVPSSDEIAIVHKDGRRVELGLTWVPMRVEGEITGVFGIAKDITRRRSAEDERAEILAREQEARSRAVAAEQRAEFLATASELMVASLDYETTLTSVANLVVPQLADWCEIDVLRDDGSLRRLVGTADTRLQGRIDELQRRYAGREPGERMTSRLMDVIRSGKPEFVPDIAEDWVARQGITPELLTVLRSLDLTSYMRVPLIARDHALGAITFAFAGSGRRYSEADLALGSELGRRAALAVDNARLFREAQRAIELRDEFLAAASHDLRTPVTTIKAHAQLLQRTILRGNTGKRRSKEGAPDRLEPTRLLSGLQSIDEAGSRIAAQIEELMDLSRLQSGRPLELHRTSTDLVALARRCAETHQQFSQQPRIRVEAEQPELIGSWDSVRLERVLSNMLSNAIKYSPNGGDVAVRITSDAATGGLETLLTVHDQGIGIPKADLPHIFEQFYRARNVTGRPGSGIGLAGVRSIVEQHGGAITVESLEGQGTTFTVRLPLSGPDGE